MKTIIVLGMRSGTSLVAGLLHDMGIYMGENFQLPDEKNAKGYFEEITIRDTINKYLLNGDRFSAKPVRTVQLEHLASLKEAIDAQKKEPMWGFKAPGACFAIKAIELFVDNPMYIMCTRDVSEVGQSLEKEQQHSYPRGFNCTNYATYMQHTMHEETRGNPRHEVKYSEILAHPEREIYELGKFIGLDIDESDRMRLAKRVDPTLQHYFSSRPQ